MKLIYISNLEKLDVRDGLGFDQQSEALPRMQMNIPMVVEGVNPKGTNTLEVSSSEYISNS